MSVCVKVLAHVCPRSDNNCLWSIPAETSRIIEGVSDRTMRPISSSGLKMSVINEMSVINVAWIHYPINSAVRELEDIVK